jgi:hypothetical protein
MKKISSFICCYLLAFSLSAQDTLYNFHIESSHVVWQKKFKGHYEPNIIFSQMKLSGKFINIDSISGHIIASLKPLQADYRGAGYKMSNTSVFLTSADVDGLIVLQTTDTSVIVSISQINFIQKENFGLLKMGEKKYLDELVINKNGNFRTGMADWSGMAKILDYTFSSNLNFLNRNISN